MNLKEEIIKIIQREYKEPTTYPAKACIELIMKVIKERYAGLALKDFDDLMEHLRTPRVDWSKEQGYPHRQHRSKKGRHPVKRE